MIVKRIKASKAKSKHAHARALLDYVREVQGKNLTDYVRAFDRSESAKVAYTSSRGFVSAWGAMPAGEQHLVERAQMIALANECRKSPNPLAHWVMSWQQGEQPTDVQADEAVSILLDELGMPEHQCIYALHRDTDNVHLHIVVNRVHPTDLKVADPHNGFDELAGQRAICRIEAAQGWQSEARALYRMTPEGPMLTRPVKGAPKSVSERAQRAEAFSGEASAQRIAIERCAPVIEAAQSWAQLHAALAPLGARYAPRGSGAVIQVGDVVIKASAAGRACSLGALQKRLGDFEPAPEGLPIATPAAVPVASRVAAPGWGEYAKARRERQAERNSAQAELRERHQGERDAFFESAKARRAALAAQDWKGRGAEMNAERSLLAARIAAERAELFERQARERRQLARKVRPLGSYEEWLRSRESAEAAERFRFRAQLDAEPLRFCGQTDELLPAIRRDIRDVEGRRTSEGVAYSFVGDSRAAFVDRGAEVVMHDAHDDAAVLAGLQLAASKFGVVRLEGAPADVAHAARIAARHGIRIVNPEVQELMREERQRLGFDFVPAPARKPKPEPPAQAVIEQRAQVRRDDPPHLAAWRRHRAAVAIERQGEDLPVNPSVEDREIALRMRVTGWPQAEIAEAIERGRNSRRDYAGRAASSAFTPAADIDLARLEVMTRRLYEIEQREDPRRAAIEAARRSAAERMPAPGNDAPGPRGPGMS